MEIGGRRGRHPGIPRPSRVPGARRQDRASRRPHRPRRHRWRHRLLQGPQRRVPREGRRRGPEGQPAHRAQAPAPLPPRGRVPPDQALQRLWRRRRLRGHRRAGRRPGHQPRPRAQEVRGPRRHRARHLRVPGAHGRGPGARGRGRVHGLRPRGEPRGDHRGHRHRGAPPAHELARQDHRGREPRVPLLQRRAQVHLRARGGSRGLRAHLGRRHARREDALPS